MKCNCESLKQELNKIKKVRSISERMGDFQIKITGNKCFLSFIGACVFETCVSIENFDNEKFAEIVDFEMFYEMIAKCNVCVIELNIDGTSLILNYANKTKELYCESEKKYQEIKKNGVSNSMFSQITISAEQLKKIYQMGICCIDEKKNL